MPGEAQTVRLRLSENALILVSTVMAKCLMCLSRVVAGWLWLWHEIWRCDPLLPSLVIWQSYSNTNTGTPDNDATQIPPDHQGPGMLIVDSIHIFLFCADSTIPSWLWLCYCAQLSIRLSVLSLLDKTRSTKPIWNSVKLQFLEV